MVCSIAFVLKILVGIFNLIFWAIGAALLGLGAWMRITSKDFSSLLGSHTLSSVANILMVTGGIIMFIGIIGFWALIKENKCLLATYFLLLIAIFNLEIATGVIAHKHQRKINQRLEANLRYAVRHSYGDATDAGKVFTKAVDYAQEKLKCCGASNYTDWHKSHWYETYGKSEDRDVPQTCCKDPTNNKCNKDVEHNKDGIYQKGCVTLTITFFKDKVLGSGSKIGIGAGIFQVLGIAGSITLCHLLRKQGNADAYSAFVV